MNDTKYFYGKQIMKVESGVAPIVGWETYKEGYIFDTKNRWQDNIKRSYM